MASREALPPLVHQLVEVRLNACLDTVDAMGNTSLLRHSSALACCFGRLAGGLIVGDTRMSGLPYDVNIVANLQGTQEEDVHPADHGGGGVAHCDGQNGGL